MLIIFFPIFLFVHGHCSLSDSKPKVIPKRFEEVLRNLGNNPDIIITTADKGGGVIIMDKTDYDHKMLELLGDRSTYMEKHDGYAKEEAEKFNREARKILKKSEKGKRLLHLLEEDPRIPRMKGLPKIHKPGIPMRPITSGIGSAPHKLGKVLAKPLSKKLGSISNTHIRNSGDLLNRLGNIEFKDKIIVSFDVKALFTNVPTDGAMKAVKKVVDNMEEEDLPVSKSDYVKLISLCTKFTPFMYGTQEYCQHNGLPMGSPISPVMSCLFMELLEDEHFLRILGRNSTWMRYIDDVLVVIPKRTNVENKLRLLNEVHNKIQFTVEKEVDGSIPFLDVMIKRTSEGPRFSVYRKPTNKNDYIHSLSAHSDKIKSGVIIGFFLRAIRICSTEFVEDEFQYIMECFQKLGYPKGLIMKLKNKAIHIMENRHSRDTEVNRHNKNFLIIPHSQETEIIRRFIQSDHIQVVASSKMRISELIRYRNTPRVNDHSDLSQVYCIPCNSCQKVYFGETSRGLTKRLKEHRADVRLHRTSNALVQHIDEENHLPKWEEARTIHRGINKSVRKSLEAMYIVLENSTNSRSGFINWSRSAAEVANKNWNSRSRWSQRRRAPDPT